MLKRAKSLRAHLVTLVLAAVLPLLIFAAVLIHQQIEQERATVQRGMRDTLRALSLAVDREIAISRAVLETLAGAQTIDRGDFESFYRIAQAAAARRPDARIILFDVKGQQVINTIRPYGAALPNTISQAQAVGADSNYPNLPLGAPDLIKAVIAAQQPLISDVFVALSTRRPTVDVAVPVMRGGKVLYVLGMSFEADVFTKLLSEQRLPAGWMAGVFDRKGINFGRTNAPELFVGQPATREMLDQLAQREDGIGIGRTREGVSVYHAFTRSPVTGWVTAAGVSRAQADAALNRLLLLLWTGGAVLLLLGLGTALYLGRRLAASLTRLSTSAGAMQRGESVDLQPSHVGEIEVLRNELVLAGVQAREIAQERERRAAAEAARDAIAESDKKFRLLLGGIKDHAIFMLDASGRVATWNAGAERLTGFSTSEALGRQYDFLYDSEDRQAGKPEQDLQAAAAEEEDDAPHEREAVRVRRSGTSFYANVRLTALRKGDILQGYTCVIRDVSEARRIQRERRQAETTKAYLATLVDYSQDAIFGLSCDKRIVSWNPAAVKLYGYSAAEIVGQPASVIVPGDKQDEARQMFADIENGKTLPPFDTVQLSKDGSRLDVSLALTAIRDGSDRTIGFSALVRDIAKRKQAEAALHANEERWRTLLAVLPVAVYAVDKEGRISFYNQRAADLWGRAPRLNNDEERFCGSLRLLRPDGRVMPHSETPIVTALRNGNSCRDAELIIDRSDGRRVTVAANIDPLRVKGEIVGAINCFVDITERTRAEAALRESEARFRSIADSSPVLMWVDDDAGCVFVNRAYLEFLGLQEQIDVRGYDWAQYVHPDDRDTYLTWYMECLEKRAPFAAEFRFRRYDGQFRWMQSMGVPRLTDAGEFLGYVGCTYDIHENKLAVAALHEADRRKDEFIAMLSHELRNPLAPIGGAAQILRAIPSNDPKLKWCQEVIEKQVAQMSRLMEDLLDMSRITRDSLELRKERVELHSVINAAIETSRPLIEENGHRLSVELPAEEIFLEGDPVRLAQVFGNLLNNAAKYSEKSGRITLRAEVNSILDPSTELRTGFGFSSAGPLLDYSESDSKTKSEDLETGRQGNLEKEGVEAIRQSKIQNPKFKIGVVVVSVVDEGIGIAPEVVARLFERFYQAESGKERRYGGLGIGLSLVKGIVELHGGRVEARSDGVGKGSEFVVTLPVVSDEWRVASPEEKTVANEPPSAVVQGSTSDVARFIAPSDLATQPLGKLRADNSPLRQSSGQALTPSSARKRIVVVDDNKIQAQSLAMLIEMMGFDSKYALSGADALKLIAEYKPHVALIDIGLPDMPGYEVAQRLRALRDLKGITLIAQTGWGRDEDREHAKEAGFDHHLTKPIDHQLLESLLTTRVDRTRVN